MGQLHAGVGRVVITPPVGVELAGYGVYLDRRATGVMDDLNATALVLDDGSQRVAIVALDLCGITAQTASETRRLIKESVGLPPESVMLCASHTHAGPATFLIRGWSNPEEDYTAILPRYLAGAVRIAADNLQPARAGFGLGEVTGVAVNRVEENGPTDDSLGVIRVDTESGEPLAVLGSFGAHGVAHKSTNTLVSRDWPGVAVSVVERAMPGATAMFLQGACGDINPCTLHTGDIETPGWVVGGEMLRLAAMTETTPEMDLAFCSTTVDLPLVVPTEEEVERVRTESPQGDEETKAKWQRFYDDWAASMREKLAAKSPGVLPVEVQAIRVGDIGIVSHPGELFAEFALSAKHRSPSAKTLAVGYANGIVGYIPDEADFERKGYGAWLVPRMLDNFPFQPNVGKVLEEGLIAALEKVKK